ncbi:hypothetical protein NS337_20180 [Pseudomonas oryzihabitans]|nr:hypothetical protein NS337_20180 [Pseudomonas psychrotolerans]
MFNSDSQALSVGSDLLPDTGQTDTALSSCGHCFSMDFSSAGFPSSVISIIFLSRIPQPMRCRILSPSSSCTTPSFIQTICALIGMALTTFGL